MLKFNFLNFLLILSLTGCFAGRKDDGSRPLSENPLDVSREVRGLDAPFDWEGLYSDEDSDFSISQLNAEILKDSAAIDEETGQVKYVDYVFSARLVSRGTRQSLLGYNFRVAGLHGEEVFNVTVQENDIIRWTETIEFDPLKPQFDPVLVVKKIEGLGAVRGVTHATYEINPWAAYNSNLGDAFRDLTYSTEELNRRHSNFDPTFNYVSYLQDPGTEAPEVNISNASFYINREETSIIMDTISSGVSESMYTPVAEPNTVTRDGRDFVTTDTVREYDRGSVTEAPSTRDYVLRDRLIRQANRENGDEEPAPLGVRLKLGANIRLETEVSNANRTLSFNTINQGMFRVHAAIIGSNQGLYDELGNEQKILLAVNTSPVIAEINDQMLNVEFDMVTNHLTNRGDLDLAIKVVPLRQWAEAGLKPFGGIFKIGNYNSLAGSSGSMRDAITASTDFDFDDYLNEVQKFTEDHKQWFIDNGYQAVADDIIFGSMQIRFRTVKAGETATQRTVIFDVSTCPTDGISGAKIREGRQFKILVSGQDPLTGEEFERTPLSTIRNDGGDSIVSVQDTNCMSWVDEMAHKYYQRENLIDRSYHIVDPLTNREIFTLTGYFNPWDEKFGTLGVDARNLSESFIQEVRSRKKLPSRFFVGEFSYMTLRFRYDIDENMKLTVKKTVLMSVYPYVKRYSNIINGINGNFPIRDGVYLLKIAYQKDYIDPGADGITLQRAETGSNTRVFVEGGNDGHDRHVDPFLKDDLRRKTMIHTSKKLIRVENNRVITPVEFHINELRTLRVRSNLLLQLEPINQYKLQIVNLFERHIANKLGLAIGDLRELHCLRPGFRKIILDLFQDTIDRIALAIPDDINYSSRESFEQVINHPEVVQALSYLTSSDLLEGLSRTLDLAISQEQVDQAFRNISGGELADIESGADLERILEQYEQESLIERQGEDRALGLYDSMAQSAARALPPIESDGLIENELLVPLNDGSRESLNSEHRNEMPPSVLGSDEGAIAESVDSFSEPDEPEVDESTREFLDQITEEAELERLLVNDFTIDPAIARVSDLDYLIDRKAGIVRRTFVGPLTLLALDNKNVMNATDAVDYDASSNDAAQDQSVINSYGDDFNSDYARNPNFGYQGHFKNCHVDDFIITEEHTTLLKDAWTECVVSLANTPNSPTNEITIPDNFSCDYENTQAFRNYQNRQTWRGEESSPFKRYSRLGDEQQLEDGGKCFYREVWLKKYFSQKTAEFAKEQFGNFLAHPSVTAKLVVPHETDLDHTPHTMDVQAIDEECIRQNNLGAGCFNSTDRFNLPVENLANGLLNRENDDFYWTPSSGITSSSPYKNLLEEFYGKYTQRSLKSGEVSPVELSKDLYNTLVNIAAPPIEINVDTSYEDKLQQLAPVDFGVEVQEFMCNIMLPKAVQVFNEWLNEGENTERFGLTKSIMKYRFTRALNKCKDYAKTDSTEVPLPFNVERKFRTLKTGRYFFRGGKSINFTVAQNVGVNHSLNAANKYTFDPWNTVKGVITSFIPEIIKEPVRAFSGAIKFHDYSQQETNGISDGKGLGTSAHLSMQAAELDLELLEYRRCMLVRWNEDFLIDVLPTSGSALTESEMTELLENEEGVELANSNNPNLVLEAERRVELFQNYKFELSHIIPALGNIFICGKKETENIAIREKYYYVTQHFTEGDLLDSGSLLNNPWLLTLRGYRDMVGFVQSLYPDSNFPPSIGALLKDDVDRLTSPRPVFVPIRLRESTERSTIQDELEAWQIMSKAYRNVSPTFAGLYTQLSNREASLPDWPWTQESQLGEVENRSCQSQLNENRR